MTNEANRHDPLPSPDPFEVADSEIEQLLEDAYQVPPVPRSLSKRVERLVEQEWQPSVEPATRPGQRIWKTRWTRAVPIAASVMLFATVAVFLNQKSQAITWSALLNAFDREGVVQMDGPQGTRWLSLSEGVLSERTPDSYRMLDVQRNVFLEQREGAQAVQRSTLSAVESDQRETSLVLAFLTAEEVSSASWRKLSGARLVSEQWQRVEQDGRQRVLLQVRFQSAEDEPLLLDVVLDADSQLPVASRLPADPSSPRRPLSYPALNVRELIERERSDLAVAGQQDVVSQAESVAAPGSAEDDPKVGSQEGTRPAADEPEAPQLAAEATEPPLSGASSKWRPVAPVNRPTAEVTKQADALLTALWEEHGIEPAPPADDAELMRRVYLDLVGRTPTVPEARAYLNDPAPDRFERLVDRLLDSPDHASHLATVWRSFLIPEGIDLAAFGGVQTFDRWLAERFEGDLPYDELVRRLLLAEGRLSRSGPLLFYSATKLDPEQLASRTARVFLGMRLECAQCHDHPFEPWSQKDFWGLAAFFAQISRPQTELEAVSALMRVHDVDYGEVRLPDTETTVAPKFLNATAELAPNSESTRRQQLARWMTSSDNPYFARATANRVWGHLFGTGIVDPIDDFGVQNTPKSPELLELLAGHFVGSKFDLRELFRAIVLTEAYRKSSGAQDESKLNERLELFAQMNVKTLTAEQVYDCITVASLLDSPGSDGFSLARFDDANREEFLRRFRTPVGQPTEYQGGIPQALTLMNGRLIDAATGLPTSGLLKSLEAPFFTNEQRIEVLYLATLSRVPGADEAQLLKSYIPANAAGVELHEGLADVLWVLLNSAEFTLNH